MSGVIAPFVSRADQLKRRGARRFGQFMMFTKGLVAEDSPQRRQWLAQEAEDQRRDAEWTARHGSIQGGAKVRAFGAGVIRARRIPAERHK